MMMVKRLYDHYRKAFGCEGEWYQSEEADVLIAVFPATHKRGWWTYATLELHKSGGSECVMYSYQFEPSMITQLAYVASEIIRQWEQQRSLLQTGSIYALCGPISKESSLNWVLAAPADYEEDGFDYYTDGKDVVRIMMLHAIAESEADMAARYGMNALEDLFARACVNSLDVSRPPAI